jgi:hypothetical protein
VVGMEVSLPDELNMSCLFLARYNASEAGMRLKDFDHRIRVDKRCVPFPSSQLCAMRFRIFLS